MSVKINGKKLIIEIEYGTQAPLAVLSDYQKGLVSLLHIANLEHGAHGEDEKQFAVFHTTNLINEMSISLDQYEVLNNALTKEEEKRFNEWAAK